MAKLQTPQRIGAYLAAVSLASMGSGALLGQATKNAIVRTGTAVVAGCGAAYGASVIDKKRFTAAPKQLWNELNNRDPLSIDAQEVKEVGERFGIKDMGTQCPREICGLYDAYLSSLIPVGDEPVKGWEPDALKQFRETLGLEDSEAAQAHLEVGRRLYRKRIELGDKDTEIESKVEFQKLVYISQMTFGEEKARFMLPWRRVFRVTDAQVALALKDNASQLFRSFLKSGGAVATVDLNGLAEAKSYASDDLLLSDDITGEIVQSEARAHVVKIVEAATEIAKQRGSARDVDLVEKKIGSILDYNGRLEKSAGALAGVGPVTLFGGEYEADAKISELKELFKIFVEQSVKGGQLTQACSNKLAKLRLVFGLGNKEADAITLEATTKAYRLALRDAVKSGKLESSESPAKVLQAMCEALQFPPEVAESIHSENYRAKLESLIKDKILSDEAVVESKRVRKLLCIPQKIVDQCEREIQGEIYRSSCRVALSVPTESFSDELRRRVRNTKENVQISDELALEVLGQEAKRAFMAYIKDSKSKSNKVDQMKEIRKMVFFNESVITPLVNDVTKGQAEAAAEELAKLMKEAQEAAAKEEAEEKAIAEAEAKAKAEAEAAEKAAAAAAEPKELFWAGESKREVPEAAAVVTPTAAKVVEEKPKEEEKFEAKIEKPPTQKEITLEKELDDATRKGMYKDYLMFCMTGDQVSAPMGVRITIERDQSEFTRLQQLGEILGLNMMQIGEVHRSLSDKAFRTQAEQMLNDSQGLTAERAEKLKEIQKQLNMPDEEAQKIIKGITANRMMSGLSTQINSGSLTAKDIRKMVEQGVEISKQLPLTRRVDLFKKNVERKLTSGEGMAKIEEISKTLVEDLGLEQATADKELVKIANEKKKSQMVQAVAVLRQKDAKNVLLSCRNLVAAQALAPDSENLNWSVESELFDVYSVFASEVKDPNELKALRKVLGLSDEKGAMLEKVVAEDGFTLVADKSSEALF